MPPLVARNGGLWVGGACPCLLRTARLLLPSCCCAGRAAARQRGSTPGCCWHVQWRTGRAASAAPRGWPVPLHTEVRCVPSQVVSCPEGAPPIRPRQASPVKHGLGSWTSQNRPKHFHRGTSKPRAMPPPTARLPSRVLALLDQWASVGPPACLSACLAPVPAPTWYGIPPRGVPLHPP